MKNGWNEQKREGWVKWSNRMNNEEKIKNQGRFLPLKSKKPHKIKKVKNFKTHKIK